MHGSATEPRGQADAVAWDLNSSSGAMPRLRFSTVSPPPITPRVTISAHSAQGTVEGEWTGGLPKACALPNQLSAGPPENKDDASTPTGQQVGAGDNVLNEQPILSRA